MTAVSGRRISVAPDVRRSELFEQKVEAAGRNQRKLANRRRRATGCANESRVLVVGDGKPADEKLAERHPMNGAFVRLGAIRTHEEIAGRNSGEIWSGYKRHQTFGRDSRKSPD